MIRGVVMIGLAGLVCWGLTSCWWNDESEHESPDVETAEDLSLLLVGDPFALTLLGEHAQLERALETNVTIEVVGYNDLHRMIQRQHEDASASFDLIAVDVVWLGNLVDQGALLSLDEVIASHPAMAIDDVLPAAMADCRLDGQTWALPIQPHAELLWYRPDWLAEAGLEPPRTTEDLLRVARALTDPEAGRYGLCWNAQRGQPLGQTMAHVYAAFGQPLVDAQGRPTLDTPQGVEAAAFAQSLLAVSPPDILNIAWDQRTQRFASGAVAMTYGWSARSTQLFRATAGEAPFPVGYAAAPHAPGQAPVTPIGTWTLAIPANIGARRAHAVDALRYLCGPAGHRLLADGGCAGTNRLSILNDPAHQARQPTFATMAALSARGELASWMRPRVPQWPALCDILGTVYHDMLLGHLTPAEAAAEAQRQADQLFAESP